MMMEVDSLARVFAPERKTLVAIDSEYTRLVASLGGKSSVVVTRDSLVARIGASLAALRAKLGTSYPTPIGQAFDLLGGLESSSAEPTEAERRTLDSVVIDLRDAIAKLHELVASEMPKLRDLVSSHAPR